jgi:uncharacterized damage-inducible protein DinB
MNPRIAAFADLYKLDTKLVKKALEGVSDADLHKRINNSGTSLHWIFGHIVASRDYVGKVIDAKTEFKYNELFGGNGQELKDPSAYPPIEEISKAFDSVSRKLIKRLGALKEKDINKKGKDKWPQGGNTALDGIAFMAWHEGWHLGQMGYLRKRLGYKGLAG